MKKIMAADRMKNITYAIRDIAVMAKEVGKTKKIIALNVGDPNKFDFDTPYELKEAVNRAMLDGHNYYSDSAGVDEAREAIAKHNKKMGIDCTENDVLMTTGVSEGISMCIAALANKGENFLGPKPTYPVYTAYSNLFEVENRLYPLDEEDEWELKPEEIEKQITDKTKGIVLINPNNPTGGVYEKNVLKEVVEIAGQHNLIIFADEIYDMLVLDGEMHHIAEFSKDVPVVTFNGLAKNFLAPGWRCGWMTFTDRAETMQHYKDAVFQLGRARLCTITPQQFAVKPALEGGQPHLKETIEKLRRRRDIVYKRINEIDGLSMAKPKAAFYSFPKIEFSMDDKEFCINLLKEEGVTTVYGSGFNMPEHFRLVFLADEESLNEALDKIEAFVKRNKK